MKRTTFKIEIASDGFILEKRLTVSIDSEKPIVRVGLTFNEEDYTSNSTSSCSSGGTLGAEELGAELNRRLIEINKG